MNSRTKAVIFDFDVLRMRDWKYVCIKVSVEGARTVAGGRTDALRGGRASGVEGPACPFACPFSACPFCAFFSGSRRDKSPLRLTDAGVTVLDVVADAIDCEDDDEIDGDKSDGGERVVKPFGVSIP